MSNLLESLRTRLGLSLKEVADGTGLGKSTVQKACEGDATRRNVIVLLFLLSRMEEGELRELLAKGEL